MQVSKVLNFTNIVRIRLEMLERGLKKCQVILNDSKNKHDIIDLINKAQGVINTTKTKLKCRNNPIAIDVDQNEGHFSADQVLEGLVRSLSYFVSILLPKDLTNYGIVSEEKLNATRKASGELQDIFKEIKTALKI